MLLQEALTKRNEELSAAKKDIAEMVLSIIINSKKP